jgi:hypothetical protein
LLGQGFVDNFFKTIVCFRIGISTTILDSYVDFVIVQVDFLDRTGGTWTRKRKPLPHLSNVAMCYVNVNYIKSTCPYLSNQLVLGPLDMPDV